MIPTVNEIKNLLRKEASNGGGLVVIKDMYTESSDGMFHSYASYSSLSRCNAYLAIVRASDIEQGCLYTRPDWRWNNTVSINLDEFANMIQNEWNKLV